MLAHPGNKKKQRTINNTRNYLFYCDNAVIKFKTVKFQKWVQILNFCLSHEIHILRMAIKRTSKLAILKNCQQKILRQKINRLHQNSLTSKNE